MCVVCARAKCRDDLLVQRRAKGGGGGLMQQVQLLRTHNQAKTRARTLKTQSARSVIWR